MRQIIKPCVLAALLAGCQEANENRAEVERIAPLQANEETAAGEGYVTRGIVTSVDADAGRVTIDHAPVPTLQWPAMTMQFQVAQPALLDDVQVEDAVRFRFVEGQNGAYVIDDLTEE